MNGAEWLDKNEYEDATRDLMVQAAETCEAARAAGDLDLALGAKAVELRIARMLSLQQHCVVAAAEVLELWPAFARAAERGGDKTERRVIWGMKYAAGAAMDLPEIPLATIDQLVGVLGEMLTFWGKKPWAVWLLEARRAYIAGDRTGLAGYLEKVPPTINRYTHFYEHTDKPPHHPPEEVRAFDGDEHQRAFDRNLQVLEPHLRRLLPVTVGDGKRSEVVQADEGVCRLLHALQIEPILHPPDIGFGKGRAACGQLIQVAARHRVVSRVKAVRHADDGEDVDVAGELIVDLPP